MGFNKRLCLLVFPSGENGAFEWEIFDTDQRRCIAVHDPHHGGEISEEPEEYRAFCRQVMDPLERQMDDLPLEITAVHISRDGSIVSRSTDPLEDSTMGTYFATVEEYAPHGRIGVLLRSDLTEVERLTWFIDKVSYCRPSAHEEKMAVFKYYTCFDMLQSFWTELQINLHLPPHPNILLADNLVLEEVNQTGVVGFTMPFIPNGDLRYNRSTRPFKFKWLEQLTQVVDDLNLKHGILHQDIAPRNLLVDPATDNLLLFDFNFSARIGSSYSKMPGGQSLRHGPIGRRNDVKGVMFCVHDLITSATSAEGSLGFLPDWDEASIEPRERWVQHPDVLLDRGVDAYYDFLMGWVRRRRAGPPLTDDTDVPEPLAFPHLMPIPEPEEVDWEQPIFGELDRYKEPVSGDYFRRTVALHYGRPFVEWVRPPTSRLDRSRRLLATGRYADEEKKNEEEGKEEEGGKEEEERGKEEEEEGGEPSLAGSSETSRPKSRRKAHCRAVRFSARLAAKKKGGTSAT